MTKTTSKESPRIPIDTCEGLFEKVKWDYQQLQNDWNEYHTFNFVITAYHLYDDWIKNAGSTVQKKRKEKLPQLGKKLFDTLRDITNASKHWQLNKQSRGRQIVEAVSKREIADWYAYFVAGPVMYISVDDARPSIPEIAGATIECLQWVLYGETIAFPETLSKQLGVVFRPLR